MSIFKSLFLHSRLFPKLFSACLAASTALFSSHAIAQESGDAKLPDAARLAIRAKAGDMVKLEGDRKITTHIHLEALLSEFSTETNVKDQETYEFRGHGPNGTLQFEFHGMSKVSTTNAMGQAAQPRVIHAAGITTVKPNMAVVKSTVAAGATKTAKQPLSTETSQTTSYFGGIRFPDKSLKSGDTWSGSYTMTGNNDLRGITISYQATLVGFEMYQSYPCAHIEVNYSYKGPLPAIETQVRKSLPKGSKLTSAGQLTGNETTYYVLDRGWPLNDQVKLTVALNLGITANDRQIDVGGTIDTDMHLAVVGYPPYEPSLVPAVGSSASN